jgi:hypothetical protein
MRCETCQRDNATVHIKMVDCRDPEQLERHFCPDCAEAFRNSDPTFRLVNVPMVHLLVVDVSPERTRLRVIGTRFQGEVWEFLTPRLSKLYPEPLVGAEFEIEDDDAYVAWLKGKPEAPE